MSYYLVPFQIAFTAFLLYNYSMILVRADTHLYLHFLISFILYLYGLKEDLFMVTWNNLDTLTSYAKLKDLKDHVDIKEAMTVQRTKNRKKLQR